MQPHCTPSWRSQIFDFRCSFHCRCAPKEVNGIHASVRKSGIRDISPGRRRVSRLTRSGGAALWIIPDESELYYKTSWLTDWLKASWWRSKAAQARRAALTLTARKKPFPRPAPTVKATRGLKGVSCQKRHQSRPGIQPEPKSYHSYHMRWNENFVSFSYYV